MPDSEIKKQALMTSLRILAAAPKSRSQLAGRLCEKGYPAPVIRETLDQLEDQKLLNDARLAKDLTERFRVMKPSGKRRISFELKKRGIPQKIQNEVLEEIDEVSELETARELAASRWSRHSKDAGREKKKKVYDFLIRRGFDFQIARSAVEQVANEEQE